jgi:hypothetical protein
LQAGIDNPVESAVAAVSPLERKADSEDDESDEEEGVMKTEEIGERIRAEKEDGQVKRMTDPMRPTEREIEDHNRTHLPYRNWCPCCVQARGKDLDHRKAVDEERGLSEFSFDYGFPGNELGYKLTMLVGRERATGMMMATVVPAKGSKASSWPTRCWTSSVNAGTRLGTSL